MIAVKNKRMDRISIVGTVLSIIVVISVLTILLTNEFPTFAPAKFLTRFIESSGNTGQGMSGLLWEQRYLDLIIGAFLILASATSCVALLKPSEDTGESR